ncbi:MAG TPA: YfiR family protein [Terriglobales bacterium]|nr:YfiR family protein [Terriglobales bacterium]
MSQRNPPRRIFIDACSLGKDWGSRAGMFLLCLALCFVSVVAAAQSASEYQVKAAFLFNFAKFVEWPADAFPTTDAPLQVCVLGQDPFGGDFEQMIEDKTVNGHRLEIVHPEGVPQARACQVLFIASSEKQKERDILRGLAGVSVLTVGDIPGFAKMGGIINFVLDENRVRFEINVKAAERVHLKLSARLLTVAKLIVTDEEAQGN